MDTTTTLTQLVMPIVLALALAVGFGLILRRGLGPRRVVVVVLTAVILLLPLIVPVEYPSCRAAVVLVCVFTVMKLYDAHRAADLAGLLSRPAYLAFVVHPFTLVQRKLADEPQPPIRQNVVYLLRGIVVSTIGLAACLCIWRIGFTNVPFALEHVVKTIAFMALIYGVNATIQKQVTDRM